VQDTVKSIKQKAKSTKQGAKKLKVESSKPKAKSWSWSHYFLLFALSFLL
jgi:hypothetical protein